MRLCSRIRLRRQVPLLGLLLAACLYGSPDPTAVVQSAGRSAQDRALDAGRKPAELLAFAGVRPGMRVGELGAAGGYTTELLARAVGERGIVYAQNPRVVLERFAAEPWAARLAKPVMQRVVRLDREFDDPFPEEVRDLDLVMFVIFYHDSVWMKTDRARMNRAVFSALRPGGSYVVVDHSARPGAGVGNAQTLHRIEESVVRGEVESAGFRLAAEGDFLRAPQDTRDWNAAPRAAGARRGESDRFVLRYVKPVKP